MAKTKTETKTTAKAVKKPVPAVDRAFNEFSKGRTFTAQQIEEKFDVKNGHDVVYTLRRRGVAIVGNAKTTKDNRRIMYYNLSN